MAVDRPITMQGAALVAALLAVVAAWLARPVTFQIEGVSMAPALLPDDLVTTAAVPFWDRVRQPRRFDRWVLRAPDGTRAIKRVAGLPGETIAFVAGDLALHGTAILKGPQLLADMGSLVPVEPPTARATASSAWQWELPPREVLDDADFAPQERSRLLLPVRDVGLAGELTVRNLSAAGRMRMRVRIADTLVTLGLHAAGRYAIVAGRLDGHLVVAAWPIAARAAEFSRSCLPSGPPEHWHVAVPWDRQAADDTLTPHLALGIDADDATAVVERVAVWRDVLYRPPVDGTSTWRIEAGAVFLLGDFPSGSIDSRRWGPVPRAALQQRIIRRAW